MGIPSRIGRFRVLAELGQGAMGTVYRGRDETLEREVAVKVMSRGLADADSRARFLREARAAARLQHPNIVVIYELGEHDGAPFMALELLEGVDLQRGIEAGVRPDPRATLPVVLQLLAGLGHAHEHGIVHRDVKPSNVFLPIGRPAKIMDFGVARLAGTGTTTSGVVVGTPNYMSPEQASSGDIDGRSDLFSAGLILFELVTGEKAFRADTLVSILYKILNEAPDLSLIPPGPGWDRLRRILGRALARRREERYPDARTMSADLQQALVELGGVVDLSAPADQALLVRPRPRPQAAVTVETERPEARPKAPPRTPAPRPATPVQPSPPAARARSLRLAWVAGAGAVLVAGLVVGLLLRRAPAAPPSTPPASVVAPTVSPSSAPSATKPAPSSTPDATPAAAPVATPSPPAGAPSAVAASAVPAATPAETAPAVLGTEARILRARDLLERGRYSEALAEARSVLERVPTSREASAVAQEAEAELVIEECLRNARAALREGDRERALEEVRRGFLIRKNDPRLLAMHREAVQQ
jgi:serine/threonine protein kinase